MTWRDTGSGTSGNGYSTRILSMGEAHERVFAIRLGIAGLPAQLVEPAEGTWGHAEALGQRFCHAWACWQSVQRRERLLAQGFAVLGGC